MNWLDANAKWVVALTVLAAIATIIGTLYSIGTIHFAPKIPEGPTNGRNTSIALSPSVVPKPNGLTAVPPPARVTPPPAVVVPQPAVTPPPAVVAPQPVVTPPPAVVAPTPDNSVREINNDDSGISYTGSCGYNHGLSSSLYNDDVEICNQQNDSFTYTFTGTSIYLVTVYYQGRGGTISCYIDGSFTQSFNLNSSTNVDSYGLRYGIELAIAPKLVYKQHTASCKMTSASGTYFFVDALIINK